MVAEPPFLGSSAGTASAVVEAAKLILFLDLKDGTDDKERLWGEDTTSRRGAVRNDDGAKAQALEVQAKPNTHNSENFMVAKTHTVLISNECQ